MDKQLPSLRLNERAASWFSYAIVSVMLVCAIFIAVRFGQALIPTWQGGYLVVLGFLVALEAFITQPIRKNLVVLDQEWFIFYLAEFVVLVFLLKFFQLVWGGLTGLQPQIAALQQDFADNFFNTEFLLSLCALLIIWIVSLAFSSPLEVLRVSQQNLEIEEEVGTYSERSAARRSLVDMVLLVGLVMVFMTSLIRSDRTSGWFQQPVTRLEVVVILVYFGLGLVLLSLTQYSVMQMRWAINRIPASPHLARSWALYGLLFLALVAGVSLLLPTRYTIGLLTLLNIVLNFIFAAIQLLIWLILAVIMLAAYYLGMLSGANPEREPLPPAPLPTPPPPTEAVGYNFDLLQWIGSILFWGVMAVGLVYLLVYFFRVRRQDMARLARFPLFSGLSAWLSTLRKWIKSLRRQVVRSVRTRITRLRRAPSISVPRRGWGYTSLRRMSPRQRVIFYYLALVRRAGESGAPRQKSQTPYEYASHLSVALGEDLHGEVEGVQADLDAITERFLDARYSQHPVDSAQVGLVRQSWQRLKYALRSLQRAMQDR